MSKFHHTKGYRYWKKRVAIRGNYQCLVTGVKKSLRAHHLYNVKDYPKYKTHVKKGILISNKLHIMFHCHYMGGFIQKCTREDWNNFLVDLEDNLKLFIKSDLL